MFMKYLCVGAGAIGMYVGGSLDFSHHNVAYLVKSGQVMMLSENGILIEDKNSSKKIANPYVTTKMGRTLLEGYDGLLIAVKSYDTEQILKEISPYKEEIKCCVCLQNGVENEKRFSSILGEDKIIYASVTSAIKKVSGNQIVIEKNRGIGLSGTGKYLYEVFEQFEVAGLKPMIYDHPLEMKWTKLISNLFSNATSAILNMTPSEVYSHRELIKIELMQIKEAISVMNAMGLKMVDLPGIPLKSLAWVIDNLPEPIVFLILKIMIGSGRGKKLPSLLEDIRKNSKTNEVVFLNGAVSRHAELVGLRAPINKGLTQILESLLDNPQDRAKFSRRPDLLVLELKKFV